MSKEGNGGAPSGASSVARIDLREGLCWAGLGVVILILSLNMDRLASQGVEPYAAPGLLPGLLGIGMILFGGLLVWRGRVPAQAAAEAASGAKKTNLQARRLAIVLGLCLTYSLVLIGHGLPYWLASWIFVSASILVLQHAERKEAGHPMDLRTVAIALFIGLCAGAISTVVFQRFFLVHLP